MTTENHIFKAFQKSASHFSTKTALTFRRDRSNQYLDYGQLLRQSIRLGNLLKSKGVEQHDRVALLMENQPEFPVAFFAVMYCGAVAVPLDVQLPADDVEQLLAHCSAKAVIVNEKKFAHLNEQTQARDVIVVDALSFQESLAHFVADNQFSVADTSQMTAVIFYTSGTTAQPKGVMLSHHNLLSNFAAIAEMKVVNTDDVVVSILPLHHTYAFTTTLLTPLLTGATVVFPAGITSAELSSSMRDTNATILVGVPQVFALIERSVKQKIQALPKGKKRILGFLSALSFRLRKMSGINLSRRLYRHVHQAFGGHVRYLVSGGAKLDENVAHSLYRWGFTVLEGYGLTETSPVAAFNPPQSVRIGTVGKPLSGVEIRLLNPDEQGVGEVLIKGPNVMRGYYNNPEQTEAVLRDGWFYSGDLGQIDHDGYLKIVGRKKELIVLSNGKNIVPEELEVHYGQNPYIKEIAILASKTESFVTGTDHLVAIIVIDEDYFEQQNETNIRNRLKWELDNLTEKMPSYKRIRGFMVSKNPLPRTRLGKIKRYQLDDIYTRLLDKGQNSREDSSNSQVSTSSFDAVSQAALAFLKESLGREVAPKDHLELDLGLDSLGRIELLLNLQESLGLNLDDNQAMTFFMCRTIEDLLRELHAVLPGDETVEAVVPTERKIEWEQVLEDDPAEETRKKIAFDYNPLGVLFNVLMLTFFKLLFGLFFWLRVKGKENLPEKGPYLLCPNHTSYFDGLFVVSALPYKVAMNTYFVGHSAFFDHFTLRPFNRLARLIPIEMTMNLIDALKASAYVLRHRKNLCYFPEGQRSIDGEVKTFKKGVGILLKELEVPVVPVYLEGAFLTWPRKWKWPRLAKVTVHFSPPRRSQDLMFGMESADDAYQAIAQNLQSVVSSLKEQCGNK